MRKLHLLFTMAKCKRGSWEPKSCMQINGIKTKQPHVSRSREIWEIKMGKFRGWSKESLQKLSWKRLAKSQTSRDKRTALISGLPETFPGTLDSPHHSTAWFSVYHMERPWNPLPLHKTFRDHDSKVSRKDRLQLNLHTELVEKQRPRACDSHYTWPCISEGWLDGASRTIPETQWPKARTSCSLYTPTSSLLPTGTAPAGVLPAAVAETKRAC